MKIKIIISDNQGNVLDLKEIKTDSQFLSILENKTGFDHPKSIAEFNIGKE